MYEIILCFLKIVNFSTWFSVHITSVLCTICYSICAMAFYRICGFILSLVTNVFRCNRLAVFDKHPMNRMYVKCELFDVSFIVYHCHIIFSKLYHTPMIATKKVILSALRGLVCLYVSLTGIIYSSIYYLEREEPQTSFDTPIFTLSKDSNIEHGEKELQESIAVKKYQG